MYTALRWDIKGPSTKFNVARKRKFIANGAGGGSKAHAYFLYSPDDVDLQFSAKNDH